MQIDWHFSQGDPELPLRLRPLREHWEARGPGILAYVSRLAPWIPCSGSLNVTLICPAPGVRSSTVSTDQVTMVGYLANPIPRLPEIARLAWLALCARIAGPAEPAWRAIGLLPLIIEASEYVELTTFDCESVELALSNWPAQTTSYTAAELQDWWLNWGRRALATRPTWLQATAKLGPRPELQ